MVMLCSTLFGQSISNRLFQIKNDTTFEGHLYKIVRIGYLNQDINGTETINWKLWFLNDLRPYGKKNLLNMKTQRNMSGVGLFINANYDSIYFNPAGAQNACPDKWRVPRIGEWDTLFNMNMVDIDIKMFMFSELPGYISYEIVKDDTILKKKVEKQKGGFWWSSTISDSRCEGIELDNSRNKSKGKGSLYDRAAVRCVRDDE